MNDDIITKMVENGSSSRQIAKAIGASQNYVIRSVKRLGIKLKSKPGPKRTSRVKCYHCGDKVNRGRKFCPKCIELGISHGKINTIEDSNSYKTLRRVLIDKRGYKCESCGLSKWLEEDIPLEIHHVDGDANNNTNENLKILCCNCHALTPNFGIKNLGNSTRYKK